MSLFIQRSPQETAIKSDYLLSKIAEWKREKTRILEQTKVGHLNPIKIQELQKQLEKADEMIKLYEEMPF